MQLGNKGCNEIYFFQRDNLSARLFIFRTRWLKPKCLCVATACLCVYACGLTSETEVLLIDLYHEFSINISKHATVHPVRHKPMWSTAKKTTTKRQTRQINTTSSPYLRQRVISLGCIPFQDTQWLTVYKVRSCSSAATAGPGSSHCCSYSVLHCTGRTAV